jgi:O-antigen/teichoic acid export membrane protein
MKNALIIFFVFGVIARLTPLLTLPYITRIGDEQQIANFMLFIASSAFFCMLYLFGTQFELTRVFYSNKKRLKQTVVNSCLIIFSVGTIASLFIFFLSSEPIYILGSINGLFTAFVSYLLVYYRVSESAVKFGIVDFFRVAIQYILVLFLMNFFEFDLGLILAANAIWIAALFSWEILRNRWLKSIKLELFNTFDLKHGLRQGVSILPHSIAIYGLALFDKILLKELATDNVLAQYSVGFVLGQAIVLITDSFNKVWGPYVVKSIENGKRSVIIRQSIYISLCAILLSPIIGFVVYVFAGFYFPHGYKLAQEVAVVVAVTYTLQVIYFIVFPFLIQAGEVGRIGRVTAISACIGAVVMYVMANIGLHYLLPFGLFVAFLGQVLGIVVVLRRLENGS